MADSHCTKCCERHGAGVVLIAKALEFWLCWWAVGALLPADWSGKRLAVAVVIFGLWR